MNNREFISYAKEILELEAAGILTLRENIGEDFCRAVNLILELPTHGRIIVSGMGKAGFIAMKISATFASTGIPSFFLHPAEAAHGDLGRYARHDLALILSNSGETEEILRTLPHIKKMGCPVISLTSSSDSNLAKFSDVVLNIGKTPEAGPLGIAPTTSTAVMLALGDALAMTVLKMKKLSKEDLAFYHPGGSIGRALMQVKEVMRSGAEHCIVNEDTVTREVIRRITETKGRPGAASIVNQAGKLCGIFTDGDLRRCLAQNKDFLDLPISALMGKSPKVISANKLAQEVLNIMSSYKIDQVIVVDESGSPCGMVDIQDLVFEI